eukprot:gene2428-2661_t
MNRSLEISEIKTEKLNEDMYSRDDMEEFTDFLFSAIRNNLSGDLGTVISMGALALNQVLESAQVKGVELALETTQLEDQALVDAVDKMNLDIVPRNARRAGLTSFKDEAKAMRDETNRLEETNQRLQNEVNALKQRLRSLDSSYAAAESKSAAESQHANDLERALEEAKEQNAKRVADTTQFQQMRRMMQAQSAKIRDLRKRLQLYEPEAVKEDDDDVTY